MKLCTSLVLFCFALSMVGCAGTAFGRNRVENWHQEAAENRQRVDDPLDLGAFSTERRNRFSPIEPIIAESIVEIVRDGQIVSTDIRLLTNEETLDFLADQVTEITLAKVDRSGKLSYLAGLVTGDRGRYVAVLDYSKYFVEDYLEGGVKKGRQRTGVGLRMIAEIESASRRVDLGNLFKIGIAYSKNEIKGTLKVRGIGVSGREIDALFPSALSLNEGSIQTVLETMAAVKAKFRDDGTRIRPRHFAIQLDAEASGDKIKAPAL